jgi:hypothetical protein
LKRKIPGYAAIEQNRANKILRTDPFIYFYPLEVF